VAICHTTGFAQGCLPEGITFTTQAQIDNFQTNYPGCTQIEGDVTIQSYDNITNLNGLSVLDSIGGFMHILGNHNLNSLATFNNLKSVGGALWIWDNTLLTSLANFNNLKSVGGAVWIWNNTLLTSLTGLENINAASITEITICNNASLSSCDALTICNYLAPPKGIINIYSNAPGCNSPNEVAASCGIGLSCLPFGNYYFYSQSDVDNFPKNFPNCTELKGNVTIGGSVLNLDSLGNLSFVGGNLNIEGGRAWAGNCIYPPLLSLAGLENLTAIGGSLSLSCLKISDFTGLENLTAIGGSFFLSSCFGLTDFTGLSNLETIDGDLVFYWTGIKNFMGMDKLFSIGGNFRLGIWDAEWYMSYRSNPLTSFTGLNNLTFVGGNIEICGHHSLTTLT